MWFSRRRDRAALPPDLNLRGSSFISHSYQDADARERLWHILPRRVRPFVFPPITVAPGKLVSNELIKALMDCDCLIYLEGGYSAKSFWVAFERDYALRMQKPVYAFNPNSGVLRRETSSPLNLKVTGGYARKDFDRVSAIYTFMKNERFFDIGIDLELRSGMHFEVEFEARLKAHIAAGGHILEFWSKERIEASAGVAESSYLADDQFRDQILVALLDRTPLPSALTPCSALQVYGDSERSAQHRLDDLIVCFYRLIYRNTHQSALQ